MATADQMRRDAEAFFGRQLPVDVLAAIHAEEQRERDAQAMAGMTEEERLRYRAAKEFGLAKRAFRVLCAMSRRRTVMRPCDAFFALRDRAREEAEPHLEAWALLRRRERRAGR